MLIEFRVENHRSIREEQVMTLEAGRGGEPDDSRPRSIGKRSVLPVAAVYGANASGKSNLLSALSFLQSAVVGSLLSWQPAAGIPRAPFAWGPFSEKPSLFEVTFLVEGVQYQYGFVADNAVFQEEWLYAWPKGRKQTWLERDGQQFSFGGHLHGPNQTVQEITRPNALFLSAAAQLNHAQLTPLFKWFQFFGRTPVHTGHAAVNDIAALFLLQEKKQREPGFIRELLRLADVGIEDFKVVDDRDGARLLFRHQGASSWLALEEESEGTQALVRMAPLLILVLGTGGRLLSDELESSLHPLLAAKLIGMFNDPSTNPKNAQLIFTTHDTNLLGNLLSEPLLRRDQIWFTEKKPEGNTVLYPLSDYRPRKAENLERGYLQGRYGAIPFLGDWTRLTDQAS